MLTFLFLMMTLSLGLYILYDEALDYYKQTNRYKIASEVRAEEFFDLLTHDVSNDGALSIVETEDGSLSIHDGTPTWSLVRYLFQ